MFGSEISLPISPATPTISYDIITKVRGSTYWYTNTSSGFTQIDSGMGLNVGDTITSIKDSLGIKTRITMKQSTHEYMGAGYWKRR